MSDVRGQVGFEVGRTLGDLPLFGEDGPAVDELAEVRTVDFLHGSLEVHAQHVGSTCAGHVLIAQGIECFLTIFMRDLIGQRIGLHVFSQTMQVLFRAEHVERGTLAGTEYHVQQFAHFFEVDSQLNHQVTAARCRLGFLEPLQRALEGVAVVVVHVHLVPVG